MKVRVHKIASVAYRLGFEKEVEITRKLESRAGNTVVVRALTEKRVYSELMGVETVCLRYFNVFGPRQDPKSEYAAVVPAFIMAMLAGESPEVHGDGQQTRDFTYVGNVVEANVRACKAPGVSGQAFNVALGKTFSVLDIVHTVNRFLGTKVEPRFAPVRKGDVRRTLADVGKVRALLDGFKEVDFEEGMRRTLEWFKSNGHRHTA